MKKYQNLEHTADLKIRAFGKTKEELFANLAYGLFKNINDNLDNFNIEVEREIKVEGVDEQSLLVNFLNEILSLSDINDEVYFKFDIKISNNMIEGIIRGSKIEKNDLDVKAATYNDLKIQKTNQGYIGEVVFDI